MKDKKKKIEHEFHEHYEKMQKMETRYKWLSKGHQKSESSKERSDRRKIFFYASVILLFCVFYLVYLKQSSSFIRNEVNVLKYFFPKNMEVALSSIETEVPIMIKYRELSEGKYEVREVYGQSDLVKTFESVSDKIFLLDEEGEKKFWSNIVVRPGDSTMGGDFFVVDINVSVKTMIGRLEDCIKVANKLSAVVEIFCKDYGKTSSTNFDFKIKSISSDNFSESI